MYGRRRVDYRDSNSRIICVPSYFSSSSSFQRRYFYTCIYCSKANIHLGHRPLQLSSVPYKSSDAPSSHFRINTNFIFNTICRKHDDGDIFYDIINLAAINTNLEGGRLDDASCVSIQVSPDDDDELVDFVFDFFIDL